MRYSTHGGTLVLAVGGCLAALAQEPDGLAVQDKSPVPFSLRFQDDVIAKAVRETVAESKENGKDAERMGTTSAAMDAKGTLRGDKYEAFGRQFTEAQRPGCLRPDALKHEQTDIVTKNWVIGIGGILMLPLWAKAIVTGKCN